MPDTTPTGTTAQAASPESTPEVTRALKPCPFCGGVGDIESQPSYSQAANTYDRYRGWCNQCGYGLDWHSYEADAIDAWNTRTPARGGDELREALEGIRNAARYVAIGDGYFDRYANHVEAVDAAVDSLSALLASTDMAGAGEGIPAGMKPWHGGDSAPADWDGGGVLLRNGSTMFPSKVSLVFHPNGTNRWNHERENRNTDWDIIAYTAAFAAPPVEGLTSGEGEPVAWCSPGQLANLTDVDRDGGVYLPIRKTQRGNFTMPLYAASPRATATASVREGMKWRERWYGSEPQRGSAIVDERGNLVAYLGGDEATHAITTAIVAVHNATLTDSGTADTHAGSREVGR